MAIYERKYAVRESRGVIKTDKLAAIRVAIDALVRHRLKLEAYARKYPDFLMSLTPLEPRSSEPVIVGMCEAAGKFGVGPMAGVAGVLADLMAGAMEVEGPSTVLVENGGEVFVKSDHPVTVQLSAGENPFGDRYGLMVEEFPVGIGSSSAKISHALSFGEADLVTVLAENAGLADAAATRVCNEVTGQNVEDSISRALEVALQFPEIRGVIVIRGDKIGIEGAVPRLVRISGDSETPQDPPTRVG
ncbi:MAG: UPF0280 family protein [Promethearchaeota archaeon]